jgi:hypothetical protein
VHRQLYQKKEQEISKTTSANTEKDGMKSYAGVEFLGS